MSEKEREDIVEKAKAKKAKPGSMAEKVNMVKAYNEGHGISTDSDAEETGQSGKKNQKKK